MAINEDYLYILKRNSTGRFVAENYPIYKKKIFYDFQTNTKDEDYPAIIQQRLGVGRDKSFNYTRLISSSFEIGASFNSKPFFNWNSWAKNYLDAYYIEQAYDECISDNQIKAYSHRKIGWKSHKFVLDNVFSIAINTNFGFGAANYFLLTLKFKDVEIIPYSHLVIYRFANVMQIIRNTRDYNIKDESWIDCFDFVVDVCNDYYEKGQDGFIIKYMINELEQMTNGLSIFLTTDTFELKQFYDRNKKIYEQESEKITLTGYALTIFRGEKISGAVQFVDRIEKLSEILSSQKYIDRIIDCCYRVIPEIYSALENLNIEVSEAEILTEIEYKKLLKLKEEFNKAKILKEKEEKKMDRWMLKLKQMSIKDYNHIDSINNEMLSRFYYKSYISSKYSKHTRYLHNKILKNTCLKWIDASTNYFRLKRKNQKQEDIYHAIDRKRSTLKNYKTMLVMYNDKIQEFCTNN